MGKDKTPDCLVICMPYGKHNKTKGIVAYCQICNAEVWFSDSSISALKSHFPERDFAARPPLLYCLNCSKNPVNDPEFELLKPTPEQIKESGVEADLEWLRNRLRLRNED